MAKNFVIRFVSVLFLVILFSALAIHFLFSAGITVVLWIFAFPIILVIPIFVSVALASDEELGVLAHK